MQMVVGPLDAEQIVQKWANGNERVAAIWIGRLLKMSAARVRRSIERNDGLSVFPVPAFLVKNTYYLKTKDVARMAPEQWLKAISKADPLKPDLAAIRVSKIQEMIPQFNSGDITMADIARELDISRERVRQVMGERGLASRTGVRAENIRNKKLALIALRNPKKADAEIRRFGGLIDDLVRAYGEDWRSTYPSYIRSRKNAIWIGDVQWRISFKDWLETWVKAPADTDPIEGRLCFTRIDRTRPFEPGNLKVVTMSVLIKETRAANLCAAPK